MNKIEKKWVHFGRKAEIISVQLEDKYYENGKTIKSREIYDNFRFSVQILVKIIINFSDFSVFPIFVIFIIKLDANFARWPKLTFFFYFICCFGFIRQKSTSISTVSWEFDE